MNFDKPLEVGTILNIPLTAVNFDQKQLKTAGETLIPIYHVVEEKEWMFKISSIYNDVPVTSLEKWNKIKRDDVKKGTALIVGFLKVKTDQSPLAMGISTNPVISPAQQEHVKSVKLPIPADIHQTDLRLHHSYSLSKQQSNRCYDCSKFKCTATTALSL